MAGENSTSQFATNIDIISWQVALLGGACAGISMDTVMYPIDTITTRLQAAKGFKNSGGLGNIYKGISAVARGGAPSRVLFFVCYENLKPLIHNSMRRNSNNSRYW